MSAEGYDGRQETIRGLSLPALEVVANVYSDRDYVVRFEHLEFTCVCPKTGQPDFAKIELAFGPDRLLVELKSLKLYLNAYRSVGIFHENVVNKILDDFTSAAHPRWAEVTGDFHVRGGIRARVVASYPLTKGQGAPSRARSIDDCGGTA